MDRRKRSRMRQAQPARQARGQRRTGTPPMKDRSAAHSGYFHDSMILKFTQDGKFLMQIGKPGAEQGQQ